MSDFFSRFSYRFLTLPNQTKIAYQDEGPEKAPVILFLHGLGDNAHVWSAAIASLRKNYRCIALDLPGHGQTIARNFKIGTNIKWPNVRNDGINTTRLRQCRIHGNTDR